MLLPVWAARALLTRAHYSPDYSPDKGALRWRLVRCISGSVEEGEDLEVVSKSPAGTGTIRLAATREDFGTSA